MTSEAEQSTRSLIERLMEDYPVFSTEEEFAVRDKYRTTDIDKLKDIMFKHNVGLILAVVPKFKRQDDDVLQAGMIGLQKAVNRFDWSRTDVKFCSFAIPTIKGDVFKALRPDPVAIRSFSLDAPVFSSKDDGKCVFGDIVDGLIRPEFRPHGAEKAVRDLNAKMLFEEIHAGVRYKFKPRWLRVIKDLYGVGRDFTTLDIVGKKYGISRERVRQIEAKYLLECRKFVARKYKYCYGMLDRLID